MKKEDSTESNQLTKTILEAIEALLKVLVLNPRDVVIKHASTNGMILLTIQVNKEDNGRIVGKSGRIISSLETIVKAAFGKFNKKVVLKLVE